MKQEAAAFATAQAERLLVRTSRGLGRATAKLTDIAEGRSTGPVKLAMATGKKTAEGKGPVRAAVEAGATGLKDKVVSTVPKPHLPHLGGKDGGKDGGKSGSSGKFLTVVEDIDVGVPVREAYGQWTQFQEFSGFAKGVQSVDQVDDTTTNWRAKVAFAKRSWQAHITEQVPDERIAWTSEGGKGTTKGVVTFHRLGETLTRVLLVIEYYPKGLMERTGALWRAQGRRARLDLKNFRRFLMLRGEATGDWRGEIDHGEVAVGHDEAAAEEREEREERDAQAEEENDKDARS
ncbi:SRPBCC family protein [Streptomyces johnsoniae]|uniref:SRPBCC family protein n=1 Tax=Streptomyces johnsoniae TaxID=3075532 RepID=A0ABU2SBH1_9ACTN|nr:SRPBCC family protein [Streptomyces sp. DSM 41886]MDT0445759.1 SRPBCC family protein [Streptomyces sp. DSM 41886]